MFDHNTLFLSGPTVVSVVWAGFFFSRGWCWPKVSEVPQIKVYKWSTLAVSTSCFYKNSPSEEHQSVWQQVSVFQWPPLYSVSITNILPWDQMFICPLLAKKQHSEAVFLLLKHPSINQLIINYFWGTFYFSLRASLAELRLPWALHTCLI